MKDDEPEDVEPDEPDDIEPDADEPDADEPDADEPDADEPDADEPDDDEPDDDEPDADEPDEPDEEEERPLSPSGAPRRRVRPGEITLMTVVLSVIGIYGYNAYLNVEAAHEVREACWVEDQRLAAAVEAASDDRLPALDWMVALYRARRRYVQELCDETVLQLEWWRWNLMSPVMADVSEHTQRDINKTLARAASSCTSEIRDLEKAMRWELDRREASDELRARAAEMVKGQLVSCVALSEAVDEARPGFWPALVATDASDVPAKLRAIMPHSLHVFDRETPASPDAGARRERE